MRPSPCTLQGSTLTFDRAGRALIALESDAVSCVELASSTTIRIPVENARAVAGFDDQIWIATHDDRLLRVDRAGHAIGQPCALRFSARAVLEPAPCGPPAALWASDPALALIDDFGQFGASDVPACDFALPLTGRRFVAARGMRLTLPSGLVVALPSAPVAGAVMADGKSVVLLVASRQLVRISLGTGRTTVCGTVASNVRVANRRGLAITQLDARCVAMLELGSGRGAGMIHFDHDVHDLAIDPDGRRLAVRAADGSIEVHELAGLLRRPAVETDPDIDPVPRIGATAATAAADDVDEPEVITSACRTDAAASPSTAAAAPAPLVCARLSALDPRVRPIAIAPREARAQLDRELRTISLWALEAIAAAWDTRKLGYGNEGKHPYEHEVGAILGMNRGFAAEYRVAAREQIVEHELALASDPTWRAVSTPVGALIDELGLDPLALDLLLVIAAAALWGDVARLYGILANDAGRATVDELLVQELLVGRHDRHAIAAALDPLAPLVRLGVVHVGAKRARPFAELSIDPVIGDRLRAVNPALGSATTIRTTTRELVSLDVPRPVLESAILDLARAGRQHRIVIRGSIGSGRRTLACALAHEAGRDVAVIDATALPRHPDLFLVELARSLRRAQLTGLVPCIVNLGEVTFDERAGREVAAETLRVHPGPIVIIAVPDETVPVGAGHTAIKLPVLPETERRAVWQRALAEVGLSVGNLDAIAARYKIGPGVVRQAVTAAVAAGIALDDDAAPEIETYIRQTRDRRLGQYATRVERLATWSSVVFPPDILDSLRELVARVRHGRQVYDTWGMSRTMATSRGLTALFQGQPGTGKTLVAGVIARELGLDLYQVDLSKVMSKWIGETERNLSTIFDAAEDGQVVLLFDEADSLFAKRTEVRSSNDRYANLEVNYLLQRLDGFGGIAVLTTNSGNTIDQAFKRRLSFRLSFPFPDEETREQLWRAHLPPELPVTGPLALDTLARKYQLSGGYIRNACLRAAFLAAQDETSLHQGHLERAVALEFAEHGKLSSSGAIS
ncbi:MAG TPA: ATP-binding protein [Kofleriaceae bacterium]